MPMIRKLLGLRMAPWGGDAAFGAGVGAVGAVGSFYASGKPYPERSRVVTALAEIKRTLSQAEKGMHGWTKRDASDLRAIEAGLRYYLVKDYPEGASRRRGVRGRPKRNARGRFTRRG